MNRNNFESYYYCHLQGSVLKLIVFTCLHSADILIQRQNQNHLAIFTLKIPLFLLFKCYHPRCHIFYLSFSHLRGYKCIFLSITCHTSKQ